MSNRKDRKTTFKNRAEFLKIDGWKNLNSNELKKKVLNTCKGLSWNQYLKQQGCLISWGSFLTDKKLEAKRKGIITREEVNSNVN